MSFAPLLSAPPAVQIHVAAALLALAIGPLAIFRRRRDRLHKIAGYTWVSAMGATALSGLAIESQVLTLHGRWGAIHLLSVGALMSLAIGLRHVFAGRIRAHAETMRSLYWQALGIAGLLTLLPGRTMNRMLFDAPWLGIVAIGLGAIGLILLARRSKRVVPQAAP